ncbi:MAG: lytic murein transglycosylase [Hydrogenovibrio sp.]|uniref:lytic murein transglycosylase n=1 Tax=Hydrogenovibrio sp. TaxID=2065821 RepID=UPI002870A99F|nr:lytic murein transglycosylase [Hydrogenovibrio sp.]MDR9500055.1 lytic murein transglycosylase [Hydrogenovibrio sp.]
MVSTFALRLLLGLTLSWLALGVQAYTPPPQSNDDFQQWLQTFKQKAASEGISPATLEQAFAGVRLNKRVLELDRRQPEFTRTFWQYFDSAITDWRVENGRKLYRKYRTRLHEVTEQYGVPARFIIALWGMETNYGGYTGNTPIIESLATLSYDPRRSGFFQKQLIAALTIVEQGHVAPDQMRGSWAGAMGQCQFMPTNYLKYAVDADNSGNVDLWNSLDDVFHSMGHFLQELGWERGENWGREIALPEDFDYSLADGKTQRSLQAWSKMGLTLADGRKLPQEAMQAALLLPYDHRGPAFLVYDNFHVIKRWNQSDNYALAVGHLADRIVGRAPLSKSPPKNDEALSHQQTRELQERLGAAGLAVGPVDGVIGSKTREALRRYQKKQNLPADGYPSYRMLEILRKRQGD